MSEPEPLPTLAPGTAVGVVAEVAVAEELEPPPGPDTPLRRRNPVLGIRRHLRAIRLVFNALLLLAIALPAHVDHLGLYVMVPADPTAG